MLAKPIPIENPRSAATLFVAASDALAESKRCADYVCDGTADNAQLTSAIAALPAGGGCIQLSEGTFNWAAAVTIDRPVWLRGMGWATIIYLTTGSNSAILTTSGAWAGGKLSDLLIDGNAANNTVVDQSILIGHTGGYFTMKDVQVYNCEGDRAVKFHASDFGLIDGCVIKENNGGGIWINESERFRVANCYFIENDQDVEKNFATLRLERGFDSLIDNCWFYEHQAASAYVIGLKSPDSCIIRGCFFDWDWSNAAIQIAIDPGSSPPTRTIVDSCSFNGNSAAPSAVLVSSGSQHSIRNIRWTGLTGPPIDVSIASNIDGTLEVMARVAFTADDATPDVSGGNVFQTANGNTGALEITDLDNPKVHIGRTITLIGNDGANATTINDGGSFALSAAWTGATDDVLTLFVQADNDYIEVSRSNN